MCPSSAERSVFSISMVTVIGPTPPGTGVIHEAFSFTPSKSHVADDAVVGQAVDADVDDDRAVLHHLRPRSAPACRPRPPGCRPGWCTAPGRACLRMADASPSPRVCSSISAIGLPTMLVAPTITTFLPATFDAGRLQQQLARRRACRAGRCCCRRTRRADVVEVEAVDVLVDRDGLDDTRARRCAAAAAAAPGCRAPPGRRSGAAISASTSASGVSAGRAWRKDSTPHSSQALTLLPT